jgi:hypothetical protein
MTKMIMIMTTTIGTTIAAVLVPLLLPPPSLPPITMLCVVEITVVTRTVGDEGNGVVDKLLIITAVSWVGTVVNKCVEVVVNEVTRGVGDIWIVDRTGVSISVEF